MRMPALFLLVALGSVILISALAILSGHGGPRPVVLCLIYSTRRRLSTSARPGGPGSS